MRLSGLSLAVILALSSLLFAQHHGGGGGGGSSSSSGGGSSSSSSSSSYSGGSSYGGGSHSSSGGSSYSGGNSGGSHNAGGASHSGGGSAAGEHSSGGAHNWGGGSKSTSGHDPAGRGSDAGSVIHGTAVRSKSAPVWNATHAPRNGIQEPSSKLARPIREPIQGPSERALVPQKRSFFSVLFHPFRRVPKPEPRPAIYLPHPCPHGRCLPNCPVGQVRSGGACTTPIIPTCVSGQIWNGIGCGESWQERCWLGGRWNGTQCLYGTRFLDSCFSLRSALNRQMKRVQEAESNQHNACAYGAMQECSAANTALQSEDNLRQNLIARLQQCEMQSMAANPTGYGLPVYDAIPWFDSLRFDSP